MVIKNPAFHRGSPAATEFPKLLTDGEFDAARDQQKALEHVEYRDRKAVLESRPLADGKPESTIEQRFKHVSNHLIAMWGSEACSLYIKRLLVSDRIDRQGFPPDVIEDLILLDRLNDAVLRNKQVALRVNFFPPRPCP